MKFINCLSNFFKKHLFFISFLIIGLAIFFYPMILSGFDKMPGDGKDVKIINYILEHYYLWITQFPGHTSFWDMPFFYPYEDVLVMGDMLLGGTPIYCFLRIFLEPFSAFQVFAIFVCIINYISFYYLLNKQLKFSPLSSSIGSFLFTFSLYRYYKFPHLSYFIQFYSVWILICIFKMHKKNTILKNSILASLIAIFLAIQFLTCFTLGWALGFFGIVATLISLFFRKTRKKVIIFIKRFYIYIIYSIVLFFILLSPVIYLHLHNEIASTPVEPDIIDMYSADITAWLRNISVVNQIFFQNLDKISYLKAMEGIVGIGIFTSILVVIGFFNFKNKEIKKLFIILTILIILLSCRINDIILWEHMLNIIPGANIIRAISRIAFISLIIFSITLANFFQQIENRFCKNIIKKRIIITSLLIFLFIEHIPLKETKQALWENYNWSKKEFRTDIEEGIKLAGNDCEVIAITIDDINYQGIHVLSKYVQNEIYLHDHLIAMWITAFKDLKTALGITGVVMPKIRYDKTKTYCDIVLDRSFDKYMHDFTDRF